MLCIYRPDFVNGDSAQPLVSQRTRLPTLSFYNTRDRPGNWCRRPPSPLAAAVQNVGPPVLIFQCILVRWVLCLPRCTSALRNGCSLSARLAFEIFTPMLFVNTIFLWIKNHLDRSRITLQIASRCTHISLSKKCRTLHSHVLISIIWNLKALI